MAAAFPDRPALHIPIGNVRHAGDTPHLTLNFAELNADTDALAHGLESVGIRRGTRVALMVPPGRDFFALTFALLKVAAIPVLIDPGMGVRNLGKCLGEAEPEAFVGVAKAHLARRLFGWARKSIRATVNVGRRRFFCTRGVGELRRNARPYQMPEVAASDPAAILFTSGSTGVAKGVEYTHGIFAAQVEMLKDTYSIQPGEVDLCTFQLFALFGPALGMAGVVPDMDATRPATMDPKKALAQIRQFGVTNLFGSPAVIRRMASLSEPEASATVNPNPSLTLPARMSTLRRVISAGAPATPAVLERFVRLLPPGVQVFTPYGATEALPVSNIGSDEILTETRHLTDQGRGVCVGRPVKGMTVHVIAISDDPIPTWDATLQLKVNQVGEFVVRGPVVTKRYFHRDEATKLAKIHDPATGGTLHRMGDVGYIDEQGRMWFAGRKSHRVETPHGTLFTDMVEPVFNTVPWVARTALVGVTRNGVTYPVLCVEPKSAVKSDGWDLAALRAAGARHDHTRRIDTFPLVMEFPVDVRHNSKIFREKLAVATAQWAKRNWKPPEEPS